MAGTPQSFLQKLGSELWSRVVLSYRSTLLGLAALAGGIALDQLTTYLQSLPKFTGSAVGGLAFVLLALAKKKLADEAANVVTLPTPKGFIAIRLILFAAVLSALIGYRIASAQEAQPGGLLPQAGACFAKGGACIQPAATVLPIVIDFRSGNVSQNVAFSAGYALVFPKLLNESFRPGIEALGGTQTGGGWNAAVMLRLGSLRIGPVVTHKPDVTYAGLGCGVGI